MCSSANGFSIGAQRAVPVRDTVRRSSMGELFDDVKEYFSPDRGEMKATKLFFGRDRWKDVPLEIRRGLVL